MPNGEPKCSECTVANLCRAKEEGRISEFPVKKKAKARRIEKKTVLVFRDEEEIAIGKRDKKGLLAGLYELPNVPEHLSRKEVENYCKEIGLSPIRIKKLPAARQIKKNFYLFIQMRLRKRIRYRQHLRCICQKNNK